MSTKVRIRAFMGAALAVIAILISWGLATHAGRPAPGRVPPGAHAALPAVSATTGTDDESGESE